MRVNRYAPVVVAAIANVSLYVGFLCPLAGLREPWPQTGTQTWTQSRTPKPTRTHTNLDHKPSSNPDPDFDHTGGGKEEDGTLSGQVHGNNYIEYADEGTANPPFAFHEFLDAHKPDLPNPELPISTKGSTNEAEYTYSARSSCGSGYCAFSCNIGPSGAGTLAETLYLYRDPNVLLTPASTGFSSTSFMPDHEATPSPDIWSNVPPLTASLLNLPGLRLAPHRMPPSRGHTCRRKAPSPTCNSSAKVWATG